MRGFWTGKFAAGLGCGLLAASVAAPAMASQAPVPRHARWHATFSARPRGSGAASPARWRIDSRLRLDTAESPQEFTNGFSFLDVEPVGRRDVWAVGTSGRNDLFWARPVLRHWHRGTWHAVALPGWMDGSVPGGYLNELFAVAGDSPADIWAAGQELRMYSTVDRAVHWNGHRWTKAGVLPSRAAFAPEITSMHAFSRANVWAFGCYCEASQGPYIAHLVQGRWHDVTPSASTYGAIWTAAAISPSDIWAIAGRSSSRSFALLHWNGMKWRIVPAPQSLYLGAATEFTPGGGIVATRAGGVWLAGYVGSYSATAPAVVHYAAGTWHVRKIAAPALMQALVPDGSGGLWASSAASGNSSAEIWHYAAGHWKRAADPPGISGSYAITWMAHLPGSAISLAIGQDFKNELLLSTP